MHDQAYEHREWQEYHRKITEVEKAPLHERKEAAKEFYEAMANDPALVGERIGWVLNGSYGYGAMQVAKRVLGMSKRANKAAHLNTMVAALEWNAPGKMVAAMWKKLTPGQKTALDKAILHEIKYAEENAE